MAIYTCENCVDEKTAVDEFPCSNCFRCSGNQDHPDRYVRTGVLTKGSSCDGCKYELEDPESTPCKNCIYTHPSGDYPNLYETATVQAGKTDEPVNDPVNHPAHYADSCSLECLQVMEVTFGRQAVISFCMCNAFKYMWRYKNKNGLEDLKKAEWYLNKAESLSNIFPISLIGMRGLLDELSENYKG